MAKAIKTTEPKIEHPISEKTPTGITQPISVPDVPAQMEPEVPEKPDSDEVRFLKQILHIQEVGGFGKHLHGIINDRIKSLS